MQLKPYQILVLSFAAVAVFSTAVSADDSGAPPRPPLEAFTACQGKSTSEACSVEFRGSALTGVCAPADDNTLFCKLDHPPEPPHGPPPEAFTACTGKGESATCSVTVPDGTLDGTCATSPEGKLFCLPSR